MFHFSTNETEYAFKLILLTLNIVFFFLFRTLPFNQFVKRASEDIHEEYFVCPVSRVFHSLRVLS